MTRLYIRHSPWSLLKPRCPVSALWARLEQSLPAPERPVATRLSCPRIRGLNGFSRQNRVNTFRSENFTPRPIKHVLSLAQLEPVIY